MRIDSIEVQNFAGLRDAFIVLDRPVLLACGPNGAGKSSLLEAIRFALLGEMPRVALKRDAAALVTEGAKRGGVAVVADGYTFTVALPAGTAPDGGRPVRGIACALDPARFARLDAKERAAALYEATGVTHEPQAIRERLLRRKIDAERVEAILPVIRAGWDAAEKHAKAKTSEARGGWKAITGEAYGSQKAAGWTAPAPTVDPAAGERLGAELARAEEAHSTATAAHAEMAAVRKAAESQAERLAGLREQAGRYARVQDKLLRDEASLKEWTAKAEEARKRRTGSTLACPDCGAVLALADGKLVHGEPAAAEATPSTAELAEIDRAVALYQNALAAGRRDLAACDAAAEALKAIDDAPPPPDAEALEAAKAHAAETRSTLEQARRALTEHETQARAAREAEGRTAAAAGWHADVAAWSAIAEAVAPDGIPGELLAEALAPVNARLAQSAAIAQWPAVSIGADMAITYGGRAYALCSESERWRADAMIGEAIAHLGGARCIALDRMDVLDATGREDCLLWLDELARGHGLQSAIVAATLKAAPAGLPDTIATVWIAGGRAKLQRAVEEVAAA